MDKPSKFALPSPNFNKSTKDACKRKPHFLTPSGMSLLPREKQPPPMYGKYGATVPSRYLQQTVVNELQPVIAAPPPPEKQYCEPCELELHSLEDLKRHRAQHEKCPVAGCMYKGHPTVMDKHINALHASGLFDKFKKLSTPEEIAAWREERRKRYPTLANVLLKKKAQEQRQKRGERLGVNKNRFGKASDRKRAQQNAHEDKNPAEERKPKEDGIKKNRKNKRNQKSRNQEVKPKVQNKNNQNNKMTIEDAEVSCGGIKMFRGTGLLQNYKHFIDKKKTTTNNALLGLVGMYGSDDDEIEESDDNDCVVNDNEIDNVHTISCDESKNTKQTDNENKSLTKEYNEVCNSQILIETSKDNNLYPNKSDNIVEVLSVPKDNKLKPPQINYIENIIESHNTLQTGNNPFDEAPDETPIQRSLPDCAIKQESNAMNTSNEEPTQKRSKTREKPLSKQKQLVKRKSGLDYRKSRLRKQNTMLEKLLETEIRHERNVLLQCVRYVCENNFFGIGQNNQEKPG